MFADPFIEEVLFAEFVFGSKYYCLKVVAFKIFN